MRLVSLDLERYGPFSGRRLEFRADARLHVVLGPNEAGKSSALSAVTDLLFGIEARTRYAFLHPMPEMRIGAEIAAADGRRLVLRRRKGNRNTLVDAADRPLPDDALAPFLGGLTREVFCNAFGLDAEALRRGGDEMMNAEGEVGASLAAAASGLRGYATLQKALEEESEKIFMPRAAQSRTFYQALTRYEEARKAIRASELRAGDWRALNAEIAEAGERLAALTSEAQGRAAERARLQRLRRVGPLIAGIDAIEERAQGDVALSALPESLGDAWTEALGRRIEAARAAEEAERIAGAALAEAVAAVEAVRIDEALLGRADDIAQAYRGIDRFEKDGIDLPRVEAEAERFSRTLDDLAARIGLPARGLREQRPTDAARTRVEGLIARGRDLAGDLSRLGQDLARRRDEAERLARGTAIQAPAEDPAALRLDLRLFATLRTELSRLETYDEAIRRGAGPLLTQAARLVPTVADIAALERAPLPSHETIARFRRDADAAERACERAREAAHVTAKAAAETRARLDRREGGRPIPTQEELSALRAERDGLLAALQPSLLSGEAAPPGLVARFEAAIAAADRAADALAADAARVAEHAADLRRLAGEEAEADAALARSVAADEAREGAQRAWAAAWEPAGLVPTPPAEMAAWRLEVDALFEARQAIAHERLEREALAARIERQRAPLLALSRRAGLPDLDGLDIGATLDRVEARLAALAEDWEAARESQIAARAAAEEIERLAAETAAVQASREAWAADWAEAVGRIGLRSTATPDEAASALAAWSAVPAALEQFTEAQRRVAGMRRDREAYAAKVAHILDGLAPDLAALPPDAAMKALQARLAAARAEETRRAELTRARALTESRHAAARAARQAAGEALAGHLEQAGPAAEGFETGDLHARLLARKAMRDALSVRRDELARVADGLAEASLRADLAAVSADEIEAALARLAQEDEEGTERGRVAFADRDRCERRRQELEGGMGAEVALAQRKAAEAELQSAAQDWAVLKVASLMLGTAIGRHRAGQQDPLVNRAGALFARLTDGAFAGLDQVYDEADVPRIAGRRAAGERVPVEGLSEGTRDQLYLALRLAYLEDYAARSEPAPFVGDDLFLTFDDARTGHGLSALASLGGAIQPILFTHHAHVAEIARARLGEAVEVLSL